MVIPLKRLCVVPRLLSTPILSYLTSHLQKTLRSDTERLFPWLSAHRITANFNFALMILCLIAFSFLAGISTAATSIIIHGFHLLNFLEQRNLKGVPLVLINILLDNDNVIR